MVGLEEKSHWRKSSGLCTKGDPLVPMVRGVQDPCSSTGEAESGTGAGRALRDLFFCWLYDTTMTMSKNPSSQGLFGGASGRVNIQTYHVIGSQCPQISDGGLIYLQNKFSGNKVSKAHRCAVFPVQHTLLLPLSKISWKIPWVEANQCQKNGQSWSAWPYNIHGTQLGRSSPNAEDPNSRETGVCRVCPGGLGMVIFVIYNLYNNTNWRNYIITVSPLI
jgi:hypothetical protein